METTAITIVGAGAVGLAVAFELSGSHKDIFIIEKNSSFGQDTSSRNSEVIHSGIYYPKDSLKKITCVEGRDLLYAFCQARHIDCKKIGKLIVAINENEVRDLEALFKQGLENGVGDLRWLDKNEIKEMEPHVQAEAALYSPSTGILDSHGLMKKCADGFTGQSGQIAYNTELIGVDKAGDGFELTVKESGGGIFTFSTRILINAAGLHSDKVASLAGLARDEFKLWYCKGDYFRVQPGKSKLISRLVYPVPKKDRAGLGIHATLDLAGSIRLGPDDEYVDRLEYDVDGSKKDGFYESVRQFLPFIEPGDLSPDTSGIRPKLQKPGEAFRDFIIKEESDNGFAGLINLIGIESPGLTSCLSIARMVRQMVEAMR